MTTQITETKPMSGEFTIELERLIDAPIGAVWEAVLTEVGPGFLGRDSTPLGLKLETFPGGRWYRDLSNDTGHLWGHVQSIKPPALLELTGPLFMSLPVTNNVLYRLTEEGGKTTLRFVHSAFGPIPDDLPDGLREGWGSHVDAIERRSAR
ncbi:MAG: SRPBCC domain-containing protein [Gemmatimonadota bacterium]